MTTSPLTSTLVPNLDDARALSLYASRGDSVAFNTLAVRYQHMVMATCKRVLQSQADAEDAAQETFLKLAKHAANIRGNAAAWLHACAVGTATDLLRRKGTRQRAERAVTGVAEAASPDERSWREIEPVLDAALAELSEEDRNAIIAHYLVGRPQKELAKEAGVSAGTMSRRIDRALDVLQGKLSASGLALAGAAGLAGVLSVGGSSVVSSPTLAASLSKIALAETVLAGKRAPVAGLLSGKSGALLALVATCVVGSVGYLAVLQPGAGKGTGKSGADTSGSVALEPKDEIVFSAVPRATKLSDRYALYDDRLDGEPADCMAITITDKEFKFLGGVDDGVRARIVGTRDPQASVVPAKDGEKGTLAMRITVYEIRQPPDAPSGVNKNAKISYTLRGGFLTATLKVDDLPEQSEKIVFRRTTSSLAPLLTGADHSDPLIGDWTQVPIWWNLQIDSGQIALNGGGGLHGRLNSGDGFQMVRFKILSWKESQGYSMVETICADNQANKSAIGKRIKLLVRKMPDGYQIARHEYDSKKLGEWPTFEPKKGDQVRVMTYRKELP